MSEERRKSIRVPVSIRVDADHGETLGFGYAYDISEHGLGIDAQALVDQKNLLVGSQLRIRFMLPKTESVITALGKVVRIDKGQNENSPYFALEFIHLLPEAKTTILKFISSHS